MNQLNRRDFLKISGMAAMAGALGTLGFDLKPVEAYASTLSIKTAKQTTTICPYCAVGCGLIVHTDKSTGKVINVEGDSDHPINEGALCAKGAALYQLAVNPSRVSQVLYRAPNSDQWETKPWDWALDRIAANVKKTRDGSFVQKNEKGQVVNRTEEIAHVGSAALDNEECWLLQGMMRSLGLVYIEHQARI
ncbi:MAG: twin-arginine translocation signal domain-containing protein [Desulfobacteraceae bacterium]|nr:MAG: twin-arginine translocation signal domain-containing protein [Desulfobacteraceae bacterium]